MLETSELYKDCGLISGLKSRIGTHREIVIFTTGNRIFSPGNIVKFYLIPGNIWKSILDTGKKT